MMVCQKELFFSFLLPIFSCWDCFSVFLFQYHPRPQFHGFVSIFHSSDFQTYATDGLSKPRWPDETHRGSCTWAHSRAMGSHQGHGACMLERSSSRTGFCKCLARTLFHVPVSALSLCFGVVLISASHYWSLRAEFLRSSHPLCLSVPHLDLVAPSNFSLPVSPSSPLPSPLSPPLSSFAVHLTALQPPWSIPASWYCVVRHVATPGGL